MPNTKHIREIGCARPSDKANLKEVISEFMRIDHNYMTKEDSVKFDELTKRLLVLFQGLYVNSEDAEPFPELPEELIECINLAVGRG